MKCNYPMRIVIHKAIAYIFLLISIFASIHVVAAGVDVKPFNHPSDQPLPPTNTYSTLNRSIVLHGVDISKWQGTINWDNLKSSTDFAIIRASYGCPDSGQSASQYVDTKVQINQSEARRVGILRGYYHYSYPQYNDPEPEADQFLYSVGTLQEGEILCLDYEESSTKDPVDWCVRFLDRIYSRTNTKPLLYINKSMASSRDWSRVINNGYGIWLAYWDYQDNPNSTTTQWSSVTMKQYSNVGNVGGINPVDLNVFNGGSDQFKACGYQTVSIEPVWEGHLDTPLTNSIVGGTVRISGWVKETSGKYPSIQAVEIRINGTQIASIPYNDLSGCTFSYDWDSSPYAGQTVGIVARPSNGNQWWDGLHSDGIVVTALVYHPADKNKDWRITIDEATWYGSLWKSGAICENPPNPIPISYVTNTGYIWKSGETYVYDSTKSAPNCWVPSILVTINGK